MKKTVTILLFFCMSNVYSQFLDKCFFNKTNESVCFIDSNKVIVSFNYKRLINKGLAEGTYVVKKNRLIVDLYDYPNKDSSYVIEDSSIPNLTTNISIECLYNGNNSCNGLMWYIKENDKNIKCGVFDKSNTIVINNLDETNNAIFYIESLSTNELKIPIQYGKKTHYSIFITRKIHYVNEGQLIFKIKTKKEKLTLKLLSGKEYLQIKMLDFY